jgi:hypothetical protein
MVRCERKVKQENKTGENLSLEKRRKETLPASRRNSTELKDNSQDKHRLICFGRQMHVKVSILASKPQLS